MAHYQNHRPLNPFAESYFPIRYWLGNVRPFWLLSSPVRPSPAQQSQHGAVRRRCRSRRRPRWAPPRACEERKSFRVRKRNEASISADADSTVKKIERQGFTTLMIRNVPCMVRREDLETLLDCHCRSVNMKGKSHSESAYDLLYLPMDFGTNCNLGYAFVNFTTNEAALRFLEEFNHAKWRMIQTKKIIEITVARLQGRERLVKHFERMSFPCDRDEILPVIFSPPRNGLIKSESTYVGIRVPDWQG